MQLLNEIIECNLVKGREQKQGKGDQSLPPALRDKLVISILPSLQSCLIAYGSRAGLL